MLIPFLRRSGRFLRSERAVSALEYAILAGVVVAGVGAAIVTFSGTISSSIDTIGGQVTQAAGTVTAPDLSSGGGGTPDTPADG